MEPGMHLKMDPLQSYNPYVLTITYGVIWSDYIDTETRNYYGST